MGTQQLRTKHRGATKDGGRFAAHDRDQGEVTLGYEDEPVGEGRRPLQFAEAMEVARDFAGSAAFRKLHSKTSVEDLAQDALVSLLVTQSNNGQQLSKALIRTAMRNAVAVEASRLAGGVRHEDHAALVKHREAAAVMRQDLGRELTLAERDQLAAHIRDTWKDPRHRPSATFHEARPTSWSIDEDDVYAEAEQIPAESWDTPEEDAPMHRLADQFDDGVVDRRQARKRMWNLLAESQDLPQVVPSSVSESRARGFRKAVGGDILGLTERWVSGDATEEQARTLFAPWSNLTAGEERKLVETFRSRRAGTALALWQAALACADARTT